MIHIVKGVEPKSFSEWKALENEVWKPTYEQLCGQVKKDLKHALIAEQGGICCYCERRLDDKDSHIEHLNPQCYSPEGQLDFQNMLCSCQKHLKKKEPLHCGNSKGDKSISITPLQADCTDHFTYTMDGYIKGVDDTSQHVITVLQLDIDKLNDLRKQVIEPFIIDISLEEAQEFAKIYLEKKEGQLGEFHSTITYLFT